MIRIRDWHEHYENGRTKQFKRLSWVPIPNEYGSDKMIDLLAMDDGISMFGCFVLLVEVASQCEPRGDLMRDSKREHDSATLARLLRIPEKTVRRTVEVLSAEPFEWLEAGAYMGCTEAVHDKDAPCNVGYTELNRIELNRTEQGEKSARPQEPESVVIPSMSEIQAYAELICFADFNAEKFKAWADRGKWKRNGSPMDWRAEVRYWKATESERAAGGKPARRMIFQQPGGAQ